MVNPRALFGNPVQTSADDHIMVENPNDPIQAAAEIKGGFKFSKPFIKVSQSF